jgi:hypothetical protein
VKIIHREPKPVYELSDLIDRPINGQFYNYELVKFSSSKQTKFEIDKIVRSRRKNGIKQVVNWRGYGASFNSWLNAFGNKKILIF